MIQPSLVNQLSAGTSAAVLPGLSAPFGEVDFAAFQKRVELSTRILLSEYKSDQMRRRIATLAEKSGCKSFVEYARIIEQDSTALSAFLDRMTINVTELMRNPDRFDELAKFALPELMARRKGTPISVWSAGCSYGAEAYTVAMLLHELDPTVQHKVKGTDLDLAILAKADRPTFTPADMLNVSPARRETHFHELCGSYQPKMHLKSRVRFSQHDLLAHPYPNAEYDLVLCRNVVIYFTDDAKDRIYRGLFQSLKPGGILFVGGTERIADHRGIGFESLRPFFYRKPL